jgi:hypothetical protein
MNLLLKELIPATNKITRGLKIILKKKKANF